MRAPLPSMSVKYKLPMMFGAVCLLAFGVGGYLVSRSAMRVLEQEALDRLIFQGKAYAIALDSHLRSLIQRAEDFASDGHIRTRLEAVRDPRTENQPDTSVLEHELRQHLTSNKLPLESAFQELTILDSKGDIVVPGIEDLALVRQVSEASTTDSTWVSGILRANSNHPEQPALAVTTPVWDLKGKEIIGLLIVWIDPAAWILGAIRTSSPDSDGDSSQDTEVLLTLYDRNDRGIEVPKAFLDPSATAEEPGTVRRSNELSILENTALGKEQQSSYSPVRATFSQHFPVATNGWTVRVKLKSHQALDTMASLQSRLLAVGIVLASFASLLLYFPMRYLVRPLLNLEQAARRIKSGDFETRVPVESSDEIGELSESFNAMAAGLEERTARIRQNTRELRKKEEEVRSKRDRLNAVISSMRDGIVVLDAQGRVELSNHAARPFLDVLTRHYLELHSHHICRTKETENPQSCADCLLNTQSLSRSCVIDANSKVFEIHSTPIGRPQKHSGRVLVARNVSDRIALDEQHIHQERLAVLGEVAAVMAHELNNPLTSISMFNQMLGSELDQESSAKECVDVIQRNVKTCMETIRNLLDYSTGATPEIEVVDLHVILKEVMRFLHPVSKRAPIKINWSLKAEEPGVRGDEVQLRQVFTNLIMNAFQAMSNGGNQVSIQTRSDENNLEIEIIDDGPGIPEEIQDKIFRPFYTSKPRGSGTGLGLSTSRRITEMHGGRLELLESRSGRTAFRVTLRHQANKKPHETDIVPSSPEIQS